MKIQEEPLKISELVKMLNKIKRNHGDIIVVLDMTTVDEDRDTYECLTHIGILGVYKTRWDDDYPVRGRRALILGAGNFDTQAFDGPQAKPLKP